MDIGVKCKAMPKEEVEYLLSLVQASPVLTCKATDATTNKLKEEAWQCLTDAFNFERDSPRSKEQLKLKWENLKKAARKKAHLIEMRNASGSDMVEHGKILDKVIKLLQTTSANEAKNAHGDIDDETLENGGDIPVTIMSTPSTNGPPRVPMSRIFKNKFKRKSPDDGRIQRDLSIAKYYQLKAEKLRLEIKLLNMEIANKEKNNK